MNFTDKRTLGLGDTHQDNGEALEQIDLILEGLSSSDPARKPFLDLRELFSRDFNMVSLSLNSFNKDDLTKLVKKKLNNKNMIKALENLFSVTEKYRKELKDNLIEEYPKEAISIVVKDVSIDVSIRKVNFPTSVKVVKGADVKQTLYYSIGNKVINVENIPSSTDGNVMIELSYPFTLPYGSLSSKKTLFLRHLERSVKNIDPDIVDIIKEDTKVVMIKETTAIGVDTIVDAVVIKDANTGTIISVNRITCKNGINPISSYFSIRTNDITLKGKRYYRVIDKDTVVDGEYAYSPDNPAIALISVIAGKTVEITDSELIRNRYHVYSNKADADNFATRYNEHLQDLDKTRESLEALSTDIEKRERALTIKLAKSIADKNEAETLKKKAEADKIGKEGDILESEKLIKDHKVKNLTEDDFDKLMAETRKERQDMREDRKSSNDDNHMNLKNLALVAGLVGTGYQASRYMASSGMFAGIARKALIKI